MTSPFTDFQSKVEFKENNSKYFCSKQNPNHTVTLKTKAKTLVATLKRLTNMNKIAYNRIRIESTWNWMPTIFERKHWCQLHLRFLLRSFSSIQINNSPGFPPFKFTITIPLVFLYSSSAIFIASISVQPPLSQIQRLNHDQSKALHRTQIIFHSNLETQL